MNLPLLPSLDIAAARLPLTYEQAKAAIARCAEIDECKDWADKAEALASYARQSEDRDLLDKATRIRARAIDRCGELLRQIPPAHGANQNIDRDAPNKVLTRKEAAKDAGLSPDQAATALQVNAVPREAFEALVEGADPPSVTKLAEMGRKKQKRPIIDLGNRSPQEFAEATSLIGVLTGFVSEAAAIDVAKALRGCDAEDLKRLSSAAETAANWIRQFAQTMRGSKWRTIAKTSQSKSTRSSKRS